MRTRITHVTKIPTRRYLSAGALVYTTLVKGAHNLQPALTGWLRRQYRAALGTTGTNNRASASCFHAGAKPVGPGATDFGGLKGSFHERYLPELRLCEPMFALVWIVCNRHRRNPSLHRVSGCFVNKITPLPILIPVTLYLTYAPPKLANGCG